MNTPSELAKAVSQRFKSRIPSAFPTKDINSLVPDNEDARDLFHFQIEMFLSDVAGYASSAWRMHREPKDKLDAAKRFLSQSFFEKHPEYKAYRAQITPGATPNLFRKLEEAEQNRVDVLSVVEDLLTNDEERDRR